MKEYEHTEGVNRLNVDQRSASLPVDENSMALQSPIKDYLPFLINMPSEMEWSRRTVKRKSRGERRLWMQKCTHRSFPSFL